MKTVFGKLAIVVVATLTVTTGGLAFAPQAKAFDIINDFLIPNFNSIRANTVGRLFEQIYLGSLDAQTIESLKVEKGGDWEYVVTDWCNNMASARNPIPVPSIPYIGSTWRIEGGGVANCYSRVPN
jgi:hypothetical protein